MNKPAKIEVETLQSAYAKAFAEIDKALKSSTNPHFKSKYADITAVIESIKPALVKHGLFFTQHPMASDGSATIETKLWHDGSDECLSLGTVSVPVDRANAQGYGSALTYARRYGLVTAFGVPVEDDDGNAAAAAPPKRAPAHSKLKTQVRAFVSDLEGCGDADELNAFLTCEDSLTLVREVKEKLPQWWEGGPDMQEEFVPLFRRIELAHERMKENT